MEAERTKFRDTVSRVRCCENTANNAIRNSMSFSKLYQNNMQIVLTLYH